MIKKTYQYIFMALFLNIAITGGSIGLLLLYYKFFFINRGKFGGATVGSISISLFLGACFFTIILFAAGRRFKGIIALMRQHARKELGEGKIKRLAQLIINTPIFSMVMLASGWALAGLVIPMVLYVNFSEIDSSYAMTLSAAILFLGGAPATMFSYLTIDYLTRRYIPDFFPGGDFSGVRRTRSMRLYVKFFLTFFTGGLLPVLLLFFVSRSYIVNLSDIIGYSGYVMKYNLLFTGIALLAFLLAIVSSLYFSRSIAQPLMEIVYAMKRVAGGDLGVALQADQKDEISAARQGFNAMVEGLRETFRLKEELLVLEQELKFAGEVQNGLLTGEEVFTNIEGLEIDTVYVPYNGRVGGDYYHIEVLSGGTASLIVADATGHGMHAALTTMQIDIVNSQSSVLVSPAARLKYINNFFYSRIKSQPCFTAVIVNIYENKIVFASGGHPGQLLIRSGGEILELKSVGRLVGFTDDIDYDEETESFCRGDVLLMFTDGIFEVFSDREEELDMEGFYAIIREAVLLDLHKKDVAQMNKYIVEKVKSHAGKRGLQDDLTLISLKKTTGPEV